MPLPATRLRTYVNVVTVSIRHRLVWTPSPELNRHVLVDEPRSYPASRQYRLNPQREGLPHRSLLVLGRVVPRLVGGSRR